VRLVTAHMPRYYFNLRGRDALLQDEHGIPLPDGESAWYQAVRSAREVIRADLQIGIGWDGQAIEIIDESGIRIDEVPLHEVAQVFL